MRSFLLLLLLLCLLSDPARSQQEALDYLKEISGEYEQVVRSQWQYARSVVEGNDYQREKDRLLKSINEAEDRIRAIRPYRDERAIKDSLLLFLSLNREMIREDYTRLADLQSLEDQSFEELDEFLFEQENAYKRLGSLATSLRAEEDRFAKKYGIKLINRDDRFARRLLELNDLFSYYNTIYLSFYKAYSQELVVFRTIEERDPERIRPELKLLGDYAGQGLRSVRKEGGYKGNRKLYEAALESLEFYKREAEQDLTIVAEYYEQLKKLETLKEARKEGARNAEEYNRTVREINAAAGNLNAVNEKLNKERAQVLYQWNEVSSEFLAIQLP